MSNTFDIHAAQDALFALNERQSAPLSLRKVAGLLLEAVTPANRQFGDEQGVNDSLEVLNIIRECLTDIECDVREVLV